MDVPYLNVALFVRSDFSCFLIAEGYPSPMSTIPLWRCQPLYPLARQDGVALVLGQLNRVSSGRPKARTTKATYPQQGAVSLLPHSSL
jgi:hypothetical protein